MMGERVDLLGLPLDPLTMDETVERVVELINSGQHHQHVVLNASKVVQAADDPQLAAVIRGASLVNADGMAVVWAARLLGREVPERVAGIDLMDRLLARAATDGYPVYLLGARPEVVQQVEAIERRSHPGLVIAGRHDGYWSPEDEAAIVADIGASGAAILLIAMSSPRKELFVEAHRQRLGVPFVMGVGGSFDVVAGLTNRAPPWMQRMGLEWAYRFAQEPRRMFRRYLVGNTRFLIMVLRARLSWSV